MSLLMAWTTFNGQSDLDTSRCTALAEGMSRLLTAAEITDQLRSLPDWRTVGAEGQAISATFKFADFKEALNFVNEVGDEAEQLNHHPDIDIRWNKVTLTLSTHSEGGLTQRDFELAQRIRAMTAQ
jgi:4a-hydroxytetrahydrobiopterin dehydratase